MGSTRVTCHLNAPRARVYSALVDVEAIAVWKVPAGMTCHVHEFVGREGGTYRITITLSDTEGGTELVALHEGLPDGVPTADNEAGWTEALARLAALVESG